MIFSNIHPRPRSTVGEDTSGDLVECEIQSPARAALKAAYRGFMGGWAELYTGVDMGVWCCLYNASNQMVEGWPVIPWDKAISFCAYFGVAHGSEGSCIQPFPYGHRFGILHRFNRMCT